MPNYHTDLALSGPGVAPYSARGLSQTLELIDGASALRRDLNGGLQDISHPQFRKYKTTITCSDHQAPALDRLWPGTTVTVDCAAPLTYKTSDGPQRVVVPGSTPVVDGAFTTYRPRLTMKVVNHNQSRDEYGAVTAWTLELEEV